MTTIVIPTGMKACVKCGSLFKIRASAICNKCSKLNRLKHLQREGRGNAKVCSGCNNAEPDVSFQEGYSTCNNCVARAKGVRSENKERNSVCNMYIPEIQDYCKEELFNSKGSRFCEKHTQLIESKKDVIIENLCESVNEETFESKEI